jgi:hypothetical protein
MRYFRYDQNQRVVSRQLPMSCQLHVGERASHIKLTGGARIVRRFEDNIEQNAQSLVVHCGAAATFFAATRQFFHFP